MPRRIGVDHRQEWITVRLVDAARIGIGVKRNGYAGKPFRVGCTRAIFVVIVIQHAAHFPATGREQAEIVGVHVLSRSQRVGDGVVRLRVAFGGHVPVAYLWQVRNYDPQGIGGVGAQVFEAIVAFAVGDRRGAVRAGCAVAVFQLHRYAFQGAFRGGAYAVGVAIAPQGTAQ